MDRANSAGAVDGPQGNELHPPLGLEEKLHDLLSALKVNGMDEWPGKPSDEGIDLLSIMTTAGQGGFSDSTHPEATTNTPSSTPQEGLDTLMDEYVGQLRMLRILETAEGAKNADLR
ncbi:unnamed protein product [Phytomonas sp. Hart1]|nr:unnamed protein product [Phytomonas sp. Hart1]|eukprot:CCW69767.1 unnamed protein product [Phytomonas sp. isolate Hart1]